MGHTINIDQVEPKLTDSAVPYSVEGRGHRRVCHLLENDLFRKKSNFLLCSKLRSECDTGGDAPSTASSSELPLTFSGRLPPEIRLLNFWQMEIEQGKLAGIEFRQDCIVVDVIDYRAVPTASAPSLLRLPCRRPALIEYRLESPRNVSRLSTHPMQYLAREWLLF